MFKWHPIDCYFKPIAVTKVTGAHLPGMVNLIKKYFAFRTVLGSPPLDSPLERAKLAGFIFTGIFPAKPVEDCFSFNAVIKVQ
jgi:hypothetical protein